jgi:hypothetical protein
METFESKKGDRFHDHEKSEPIECLRLDEDAERTKNWKRWGPYLSERQVFIIIFHSCMNY